MRELLLLVMIALSTACVSHYDPPLPAGSPAASVPLSLGVVAADDDSAADAVALLRSAGVFREVKSASTANADLVVSVGRFPIRGPDHWCYGDGSIALAFLTAGLLPACGCSSGYLMTFSSPESAEVVEFRFEHEACSWFGWIPLFWNARPDYHWYGGPDQDLEAAHLAAQLTAVEPELASLASRSE